MNLLFANASQLDVIWDGRLILVCNEVSGVLNSMGFTITKLVNYKNAGTPLADTLTGKRVGIVFLSNVYTL